MANKEKSAQLFWMLFKSTFVLSAFTFGGGYVIVPLMQKKFVEELKWIEADEMLDLVALGQSAPGAIAVNTSILIGYRMAGLLGALVTVFGTVTPPLIIITLISYFYMNFRENPIVDALMIGMQAGVAAVIVNVVIGMVSGVVKQRDIINTLLLIAAFTASYFFDVHVVLIIFLAGLIGFINLSYRAKMGVGK